MAVEDINCHIARDRFGCVDTTAIERIDVSIVDLPVHITVNLFLAGTCCFLEMSATDIALGIIILTYNGILIISTREIEAIEFTARHRDWDMGRGLVTVTVGTQAK